MSFVGIGELSLRTAPIRVSSVGMTRSPNVRRALERDVIGSHRSSASLRCARPSSGSAELARRRPEHLIAIELQQLVAFTGTAVAAEAKPSNPATGRLPAGAVPCCDSYCTRWRKAAEVDRRRPLGEVRSSSENRCKPCGIPRLVGPAASDADPLTMAIRPGAQTAHRQQKHPQSWRNGDQPSLAAQRSDRHPALPTGCPGASTNRLVDVSVGASVKSFAARPKHLDEAAEVNRCNGSGTRQHPRPISPRRELGDASPDHELRRQRVGSGERGSEPAASATRPRAGPTPTEARLAMRAVVVPTPIRL
jgi:hypothetical protein